MSPPLSQISEGNTIQLPEESSESFIQILPVEILQFILTLLTEKEALIAAIVCRSWREQIGEIPQFKTGRLFKVIKEYYKLEKELTLDREFHLNPICTVGSRNLIFGGVTDSGFMTVREPYVNSELAIFPQKAQHLSESFFVGSFENKGFFDDELFRNRIEIYDLETAHHIGTIDVYHGVSDAQAPSKPIEACFDILKCFVLPTKEVVIVTTGGIVEIWDVTDAPKLKFYKDCFPNLNDPQTVIAASLFGSHLILICPDLENVFHALDIEKNSLVTIECGKKIPPSLRRNIFLETVGDRCIVQIAEELICLKESEGSITVQWAKSEFDLVLGYSTLKHQNGICFTASKIGGQLKRTVLFDPENGNALSEIHNNTAENPIFFHDYCITFHSQHIFFRSLAGNSIGEPNGYPLVLPEVLKGLNFELLDVAMTKNRLLLLADVGDLEKKKRMIFELLSSEKESEDVEENLESSGSFGSDIESFVFSNEDADETEERSASTSISAIETPQVEANDASILPIAPFAEKLQARDLNMDADEFPFWANPCWETAHTVATIVLFLLSCALIAGTLVGVFFGMVNLSYGLASAATLTSILFVAALCCKV